MENEVTERTLEEKLRDTKKTLAHCRRQLGSCIAQRDSLNTFMAKWRMRIDEAEERIEFLEARINARNAQLQVPAPVPIEEPPLIEPPAPIPQTPPEPVAAAVAAPDVLEDDIPW